MTSLLHKDHSGIGLPKNVIIKKSILREINKFIVKYHILIF